MFLKKRNFYIILFFVCSISSAQQKSISIDIENQSKLKDVFPIVNKKTNELAMFLKTKTRLFGYLYDDNNELITSIEINEFPSNSDVIIGSTFKDRIYSICFSNIQKTRFSYLNINFNAKSYSIIQNLNLDLNKERIIEFIEHNDQLHLISSVKRTSILNVYKFNLGGNITHTVFDLSREVFESDQGLKHDLFTVLFGVNSSISCKSISYDIPTSLEIASAYTKVYFNEGKLTISNNLFDKHTYIIHLDIESGTYQSRKIENRHFNVDAYSDNSNSYILKDYFFYAYASTKKLNLDIYNLKTSKLIKELKIEKEDSITFKNTPIIQEGGEINSYRELEKTSKFLRKITNSNIGVAAYEYDDAIILTLGSCIKVNSNVISGSIGGVIGSLLYSSFNSYSHTKSTRIECLFNTNFDHVEGSLPTNIFTEIQLFISNNDPKTMKLQTLYRHNSGYTLGAYNQESKQYNLYEFKSE